jgi:hypothetical protein
LGAETLAQIEYRWSLGNIRIDAAAIASIVPNAAAETAAIESSAFGLYTALKAKMTVGACWSLKKTH